MDTAYEHLRCLREEQSKQQIRQAQFEKVFGNSEYDNGQVIDVTAEETNCERLTIEGPG